MFEIFWNILSFVVALGILVFVHEYGHFWVARKNGVYVERFSIGFGKVLWRTTDKQGTEFVIAAIPLGGYVKMLDERVDDVAPDKLSQTFNRKTVRQRMAIIAAGPGANFLFAIIAFYFMLLLGVPSVKPIIGEIAPNSIAAKAALPVKGEITQVANIKVQNWQDVVMALATQVGEPNIPIKVKLPDSQYDKSFQLATQSWQFAPEKQSPLTSLGITPYRPKTHTEIAQIAADSPAEKAKLQVGDKIVKIANIDVAENWTLLSETIRQYPNQTTAMVIERQGEQIIVPIKPEAKKYQGKTIGYLGIVPVREPMPKAYQFTLQYGMVEAFSQSVERTWRLITMSFEMIGKLVTGDISLKNLSGPIAIAQGAGSSAGYGLVYFLGFLALISVNLGIINLLPLPVLDGGHLFYYTIEWLTGRPVPENIQEIGFKIGALLLFGLMTLAIFNDIARL